MANINDIGKSSIGTGILLPLRKYGETKEQYKERCKYYIHECNYDYAMKHTFRKIAVKDETEEKI